MKCGVRFEAKRKAQGKTASAALGERRKQAEGEQQEVMTQSCIALLAASPSPARLKKCFGRTGKARQTCWRAEKLGGEERGRRRG